MPVLLTKLRNRISALRMAYKALTCPYDEPSSPGAFRTQATARAWLADARGMWNS